jgi:hypothetical protein
MLASALSNKGKQSSMPQSPAEECVWSVKTPIMDHAKPEWGYSVRRNAKSLVCVEQT